MSATEYLAPRNPFTVAKLDGKTFVQLTVWVLVILAAWAIGNWAFTTIKTKVGMVAGKVTTTGTTNPFYG